jgi:hypothetical protein
VALVTLVSHEKCTRGKGKTGGLGLVPTRKCFLFYGRNFHSASSVTAPLLVNFLIRNLVKREMSVNLIITLLVNLVMKTLVQQVMFLLH